MRFLHPHILFCALLLFAACSTTRYADGTDYSDDLSKLERQLLFRPDDAAALRDIGVIYFQTNQFASAKEKLERAYAQLPNDPRTMFYYGMTHEYLNDIRSALAVYVNYTDLSLLSRFRKLIEARYRTLTQRVVQEQIRAALAAEQQLSSGSVSPRAVAVFPLKYQGIDPKYEVLGKGVSEMILVDLAQASGLTVLERIRVEALIHELKFGQTASVDKSTAPRFGKLLSAGHVVAGTFTVNTWNVRMDVATWDVIASTSPGIKTQSDDLDNLFKMEKQIVFGILDELGITLTHEERQAILRVPTRNAIAFITYCLGLKSEDAFDFKAARVYYSQAAGLDPGFALAQVKAASAEGMIVAGGPKENALAAAEKIDPQLKLRRKGRGNMSMSRLLHLGSGIGSTFRPGEDDRKSAEEFLESGLLPEPPPPPGGN